MENPGRGKEERDTQGGDGEEKGEMRSGHARLSCRGSGASEPAKKGGRGNQMKALFPMFVIVVETHGELRGKKRRPTSSYDSEGAGENPEELS